MAGGLLCCSCCYDPDEIEQLQRSKSIDKMIERDKRTYRKQVKLLLLGAGESGKSTFLKQMRIIHGLNFEDEMVMEFRTTVYQNIVKGMKVLVDAREKLGIQWQYINSPQHGNHVMSYNNSMNLDTSLFLQYAPSIKELWKDRGIRTAFRRRREFQLCDSVQYFFNSIDRISVEGKEKQAPNQPSAVWFVYDQASSNPQFKPERHLVPGVDMTMDAEWMEKQALFSFFSLETKVSITKPNYIPSTQDILHARKATKGITEFKIQINGVPFCFVDVGGQRSQRQKWFHCFDSVTSILFLVSSNEFDQVLLEDRTTNRLTESRDIFDTIINNRAFAEVSFILFLNKTDLLKAKVESKLTDISYFFPEFKGDPHNLEDVQNFILVMFESTKRDHRKQLFHHFTTAIDTENIKVVFNAVRDSILQKNITQLMLQ